MIVDFKFDSRSQVSRKVIWKFVLVGGDPNIESAVALDIVFMMKISLEFPDFVGRQEWTSTT